MASPTQRTLKLYRELGFTCQVVERWCSYSRRRIDLFHCIDIVAIHPDLGIIGVQACAGASHAARRAKAEGVDALRVWLAAGGRFEVCSWRKNAAGRWVHRREEVKP